MLIIAPPALCLLFLQVASTSGQLYSYPSLPVLFAEGSHYDVGHQIGSAFKEQILTVMDANSFFNSKMLPYNDTDEGGTLYTTFYKTVESTFPRYLDEIQGMADGSNLSFSMLFLWNMMFEWQTLLEPKHLPTPSCSDLYLVSQDRAIMGHNEDGDRIDVNNTFVVHVRITGSTESRSNGIKSNSIVEEFTALCYAAELCGNAFGFNVQTGVVSTVNAVFPKNINSSAVPRNYLNRLGLGANSDDYLATLKSVHCASGFNLNMCTMDSLSVVGVEVWPGGITITPTSGYFYHFNMYLHSNVDQYEDPSSEHRLARVKQLPPPTDPAGILAILGDTADHQYPIYRTATPPDGGATITTALFDLGAEKKMFYMYRGNPAYVEPSLIIPLQ